MEVNYPKSSNGLHGNGSAQRNTDSPPLICSLVPQTQQIFFRMADGLGLAGLAGLAVIGATFCAFHPTLHGHWEFLWDDTEHLGSQMKSKMPRIPDVWGIPDEFHVLHPFSSSFEGSEQAVDEGRMTLVYVSHPKFDEESG